MIVTLQGVAGGQGSQEGLSHTRSRGQLQHLQAGCMHALQPAGAHVKATLCFLTGSYILRGRGTVKQATGSGGREGLCPEI